MLQQPHDPEEMIKSYLTSERFRAKSLIKGSESYTHGHLFVFVIPYKTQNIPQNSVFNSKWSERSQKMLVMATKFNRNGSIANGKESGLTYCEKKKITQKLFHWKVSSLRNWTDVFPLAKSYSFFFLFFLVFCVCLRVMNNPAVVCGWNRLSVTITHFKCVQHTRTCTAFKGTQSHQWKILKVLWMHFAGQRITFLVRITKASFSAVEFTVCL